MFDAESEHENQLYPYPPIDPKMAGNRIRMARKHAGYESADTLAAVMRERMGVTVGKVPIQGSSIRAIERGDQDASLSFVAALVALTGVSIDWYIPSYRPDVAEAWKNAKGLQ